MNDSRPDPIPDTVRAHFANWPKPPAGSNAELADYWLTTTNSALVRDHALVSIAQSLERIANHLERSGPTP